MQLESFTFFLMEITKTDIKLTTVTSGSFYAVLHKSVLAWSVGEGPGNRKS